MQTRARYSLAGVIFLGSILVGISCGKSEVVVTQPPPTNAPGIVPTQVNVNMTEVFVSTPIIVKQKIVVQETIIQKFATVIIVNNKNESHQIIANDGSFDSGVIPPGGTANIKIEEVGDIPFHCGIHPNETGIVRVEPADVEPTPSVSPGTTSTPTPSPTSPTATPTATSEPQEVALSSTLSGSEEVPPTTSSATGSATATIQAQQSIEFSLTVSGLENITSATLHLGTEGSNGPILFRLSEGPFTGSLNRTLTAADLDPAAGISFQAAIDAIKNGQTYINISTAGNPMGEIRGQLRQ